MNNTNPTGPRRPAAWLILSGLAAGVILTILCLALIAAGGFLMNGLSLNADCGTSGYMPIDALKLQSFAPGVFRSGQWSRTYSLQQDRVTTTWLSNDLDAVVFVEELLYNCGYTQSDLDEYFNETSFKTILFQNYQDVQLTTQCTKNDLELFELSGKFKNVDFLMYQWLKPDGAKRVLTVMMAFPTSQQSQMKTYAGQIFPELTACQ